jgi:hypothetical protein
MRFRLFKTKLVFTLGFYSFFWVYQASSWLRDEKGASINPAKQIWGRFIPVFSWFVAWDFFATVRDTQLKAGMKDVLSPARAFWWSTPFWFVGGPYVNKHLNALDAVARGKKAAR